MAVFVSNPWKQVFQLSNHFFHNFGGLNCIFAFEISYLGFFQMLRVCGDQKWPLSHGKMESWGWRGYFLRNFRFHSQVPKMAAGAWNLILIALVGWIYNIWLLSDPEYRNAPNSIKSKKGDFFRFSWFLCNHPTFTNFLWINGLRIHCLSQIWIVSSHYSP